MVGCHLGRSTYLGCQESAFSSLNSGFLLQKHGAPGPTAATRTAATRRPPLRRCLASWSRCASPARSTGWRTEHRPTPETGTNGTRMESQVMENGKKSYSKTFYKYISRSSWAYVSPPEPPLEPLPKIIAPFISDVTRGASALVPAHFRPEHQRAA